MAHPPHRTDAMPRLPRIDLPDIPQHVIQRGNDRRPSFFHPIDHVRYLDELRTAATRAGCAIHVRPHDQPRGRPRPADRSAR